MRKLGKIKLLLTASTFPRWEGDTEPRFILDLAIAYTRFFDVTVLAPAAPGAAQEEYLEGVHVIRYHYFPIHKWETLCYPGAIVPRIKEKKVRALLVPFMVLGLWNKLRKLLPSYDIVHSHWIIPQGVIQSLFKKKYILTGHGGDVAELNKWPVSAVKKRAISRSSAFTVVSKDLKARAEQILPGCNPHVISMGCNLESFDPKNKQDNYFMQNGKPVLLFVGRLAEKKGVEFLLEAVKSLDVLLFIVGSGPLENSLKMQAEDDTLRNKVFFLGAKTHEELTKLYASADIFVAPSIIASNGDKEGLPTAIMEAMASGVPVISTRTGGIPELIEDGKTGLLVEEKDVPGLSKAIQTLLDSPELREKLVSNALTEISNKDYRTIALRFSKLILESLTN